MGDLTLYCFTFTIDGELHLCAGHHGTAQLALNHAKAFVSARNATVPSETTQLVGVKFPATQQMIDEIAREIRDTNPSALPEEMSPADKAMLLHRPISG